MFNSLKGRLASVFLFMLFLSAFLIIVKVNGLMEENKKLNNIKELVVLSSHISKLVHETQKERGESAGYLGSKGRKFSAELPHQIEATNKQRENLRSFVRNFNFDNYPEELNKNITVVFKQLDKIDEIRIKIRNLEISGKDAIKYFSTLNRNFLRIVPITAKMSPNKELSILLTAYSNFLKSKERAGIERAVLSNAFAKGSLDDQTLKKVVKLIAEQDTYIEAFLSIVDRNVKHLYFHDMKAQSVEDVFLKMRKKAMNGDLSIDAVVWFSTITKKINILKGIDDELSEIAIHKIMELKNSAYNEFYFYMISSIIFIILFLIVTTLVMRKILSAVNVVKKSIENISNERDFQQNVSSSNMNELDEIGEAVNRILAIFKDIIENSRNDSETSVNSSKEVQKVLEITKEHILRQQKEVKQLDKFVGNVENNLKYTRILIEENSKDLNQTIVTLSGFITTLKDEMNLVKKNDKQQSVLNQDIAKLINAIDEVKASVNVIEQISDKTSLLAINAAIEASRAGKFGKGFKVVSDQVQDLSDDTHLSLLEVNQNIEKITDIAEGVYSSTEKTHKDLSDILKNSVPMIEQSNDFQDDLSKAIRQIDMGLQRIEDVFKINQNLLNQISTVARETRQSLSANMEVEKSLEIVIQDSTNLNDSLLKVKI
jgi:methyl-accepting chemotaxis protein